MDLDSYECADIQLMDGEHIHTCLELRGDGGFTNNDRRKLLLLTDQRVIHVDGTSENRRIIFASLEDVDAIEMGKNEEGISAFIWAGFGFVSALFLYFIIDNVIGRIAGTTTVALMSAYLIIDRLISSGRPVMVFRTGPAELRCGLKNRHYLDDAYTFITRVFELKSVSASATVPVDRFAPR